MKHPTILMLEQDDDDRYLTMANFREQGIESALHFVNNSNEFFQYLHNTKVNVQEAPSLILLNYNSTPLNAIEILKILKADPFNCHIPVIILDEITNAGIIKECYASGASSFIQKPDSDSKTNNKIINFVKYWFDTVNLPC